MFNPFARFAKKTSQPAPKTNEIAWSESSLYVGSDFPKYNPDSLIGRKGYAVYGKMMQDEQVKAVVRFRRDAITSRQYYFECEHEELPDAENEFREALFDAIINNLQGSFSDGLNGIMSAAYNGFSMTEKIHQLIEYQGKSWVGLNRLEVKPCDTFFFHVDEYGVIQRVEQKFEMRSQNIDLTKFIHYVQNPDYDKHYGRSELRECYRAWFSKDMAIKFQNIHLERFAAGFVWAQPKEGKSLIDGSTEHTNLKLALANIQAITSMILPGTVDLHIEHPHTTDMFERKIAQEDKSIAKSLLVPNLLGVSEQGQHGSLAQADTQLEAFFWTLEADTRRLEDAINEQLFRELGDFNFGDSYYPVFKFKPISEKRKMELIKIWTELVTGKAVQASDTDEIHLRELLEFPDKGEVLVAPPPPLDPNKPVVPPDGKPAEKPKQPIEETIIGKQNISISAFSKAMKRVDFAVIANKADNSADDCTHQIAIINSECVARMVALAGDLKLGTAEGQPNDIQKIQYTASEMSAMKGSVTTGLKDAWAIGESHAKRELQKAKGSVFKTDDLALQDMAAQYIKQKSYLLAGDISGATQKIIRNILMEGVKVSKTGAETKQAIYKALEADGLVTEEAVVEALGASTVKNASARINTAIRTVSFEAINEARYSYFSDPALDGFVEALEYSAILDDRTTEICSQLNGETFGIDDEVWSTFRPPNHFNCRSILIPVTVRDTWQRSDDPNIMPQKGFGFSKCEHK
jgi:SPP1 gp7 family putative phage head morphogenesis protein